MKISKKDLQLLIAFAGILIAMVSYFFVYQKLAEKAEVLENENVQLASEVVRLEALDAKREVYLENTEKLRSEILAFENRFPADILPEDSIMMIKHMEENTNTSVPSISFGASKEVVYGSGDSAASPDNTVSETQRGTEGVIVTTEYADSRLYEFPLGIHMSCTYGDFKKLVHYIYGQQERMSIEGVNIGYDASNNQLSGSMTLNTYYLLGTDKVYSPVSIPDTPLGVDTIFGNIEK